MATALFAVLGAAGGHHLGSHGGHVSVHHGSSVGHTHAGAHGHGHASTHASAHGSNQHSSPHSVTPNHVNLLSTVAGWTLSWFSPLTIAAAALWFGGVGLIVEPDLGSLTPVPAIVAGLVGAFLIRLAMVSLLQASTPPLSGSAEGALATVNATIRPDTAGEVLISIDGLTRSLPARSLDGDTIIRGDSVAVVKRERGMAWVTRLDDFDDDDLDRRIEAAASSQDVMSK